MSRPATLAPLWLALVFLTRVPLPARLLPEAPRPEDAGRSLLFYPLVGLVLGLLLAAGGMLLALLPGAEPLLLAALVLAAWVAITGALHLDGLADTVDARVGSHGDPERARTIMADAVDGYDANGPAFDLLGRQLASNAQKTPTTAPSSSRDRPARPH